MDNRATQRIDREIEHGKYLAEHGAGEIWNWEGEAGQRRWRRRVGMLNTNIGKDAQVLELGCGTGYFTRELARTGAAITAIEISPDLLAQAKAEISSPNVTLVLGNAYDMDFPDGQFDFVVGSSVLHHLEVEQALAECFRVLKSGGVLRCTEPNMLNPQIAVQKNVPAIKKWLGDSEDETAFIRFRLRKLMARHGFNQIQIKPFDFLHPKTPKSCVSAVEKIGMWVEKLPLLREIAGSLYIQGVKPQLEILRTYK